MANLEAVAAALAILDDAELSRTVPWPVDSQERARKVSKRLAVYADALSELTDAEVITAARLVAKREKFFPPPAVLLEAVRPAEAEKSDHQAEASDAYQRVLDCNTYTPEAGAFWHARQIAEEVGPIAALAFLAAGGHEAFKAADPVGDQFRFKRFVEAFVLETVAREREHQAIGAGAEPRGLTRAEAREIVAGIAAAGRALPPGGRS